MATTITGTYHSTVTLVSGGTSPLTVTSTGFVDPTINGADGVFLPSAQSGVAKITNAGRIFGAYGAYGQYTGRYGGNAVQAYSAVNLSNTGTIAGGYGGTGLRDFGGSGGFGVDIDSSIASTVVNAGLIYGGYGGSSQENGGYGGIGILIDSPDAQLSNSGTISGGAGGQADSLSGGGGGDGVALIGGTSMQNTGTIAGGAGGSSYAYNAGRGGFGAVLYGAMLTNKGKIIGGKGGTSDRGHAGNGWYGVGIDGGTLINAGTISGGAGGAGYYGAGATGGAVYLFGSVASTLVVDPGAVFIGDVDANSSTGKPVDVLELAGTSSVALAGIGTQFYGFGTISFAAGAAWKIEGTAEGLTTGEKISGFGKADKIEITDAAASGKVSVKKAGVVTIKAGGDIYELDIAGAKKGETDFKFSNHTLTKTGSPKMAFLPPPAATAPDESLPALHEVAPAPAKPETGGWIIQARPHVAPLPDLTHIPHGAVQTIVTLQSG